MAILLDEDGELLPAAPACHFGPELRALVGGAGVPKLRGADGARLRCGAADGSAEGCARLARFPDLRCAHHTAWLSGTRNERDAADRSQAGEKPTAGAWKAWRADARAILGSHGYSSRAAALILEAARRAGYFV